MPRRLLAVATLSALASCQNYNFNPVGKCILRPASSRISVGSISAADILFVVDDSGSMASEQQRLASNFSAFISTLAAEQARRASNGLQPFEFHIAVTTSSVFEGWRAQGGPTCTGAPLACNVSSPVFNWSGAYSAACTQQGATCNDLVSSYYIPPDQCTMGVGQFHAPFPAGDFVAASGNAKVLHFTKDLKWSTWGNPDQDPALTTLVQQFQQNITVGTCGSGMEQHLEASRLAVQKALQQSGLAQPGLGQGDWPHAGAKMVVVWVGDEDDCSNPKDPTRALAFSSGTDSAPGDDACTRDELKPADQQTLLPVQGYADYFTGLGRDFGAAFVYSAVCEKDAQGRVTACHAGKCDCQCPPTCAACGPSEQGECRIPQDCSGKSNGTRLQTMAQALRAKGTSTLEGSVCDYDFASTLKGIAQLVTQPPLLTLPSLPASNQLVVLDIVAADGASTRLTCTPGQDWQFVECDTRQPPADPTKVTACIKINHETTSHCDVNPGESYVARFLGIVPEGGCQSAADCAAALQGDASQFLCQPVPGQSFGTCLCNG